jgi:hypothetical protein
MLDSRESVVRFPAEARDVSLVQTVQSCSVVHKYFYSVGIRNLSPGVKRPGSRTDHSPPTSEECLALYLHSLLYYCPEWCKGALVIESYIYVYSMHDKSVPVTTAWRVLGLRMEERPPDMEGSCEYAVTDSRQGVVLQLGGWARC